jgi:hypothetical protein
MFLFRLGKYWLAGRSADAACAMREYNVWSYFRNEEEEQRCESSIKDDLREEDPGNS